MNITKAYVYCFIHIDVLGRKNAINKCDCLSENQPSSHFQIYHFGAL